MPVGFDNFELSSGTFPYPLRAVRESYGTSWEYQTVNGREAKRRISRLTLFVDVNTASTGMAAFDSFVDQEHVRSPAVRGYRRDALGRVRQGTITYSGDWDVVEIQVTDNQNKTSRVTVELERVVTAWKRV